MKAKPTLFEGELYRSRLEANYAAFFNLIGWEHVYEPFVGNGYIPDFKIRFNTTTQYCHWCVVEVKPAQSHSDLCTATAKVRDGLDGHGYRHDAYLSTGKTAAVIVGADPSLLIELHSERPMTWITLSDGAIAMNVVPQTLFPEVSPETIDRLWVKAIRTVQYGL